MKILLIDDSRLSRKLFRTAMGDQYDYIEAPTGAEGIEQYLQYKPDLVVLDIIMPEMNGLDVLGVAKSMG